MELPMPAADQLVYLTRTVSPYSTDPFLLQSVYSRLQNVNKVFLDSRLGRNLSCLVVEKKINSQIRHSYAIAAIWPQLALIKSENKLYLFLFTKIIGLLVFQQILQYLGLLWLWYLTLTLNIFTHQERIKFSKHNTPKNIPNLSNIIQIFRTQKQGNAWGKSKSSKRPQTWRMS